MPGVCGIPSPTTARMLRSVSTDTGATVPRAISAANSASTAARAAPVCAGSMATLIAFSDEPCVMSATETPARPSAAKRRAATPGVPKSPPPASVTSATPGTLATPRTGCPASGPAPRAETTVPGASGRNVLRTWIGTPAASAGAIVGGKRTLAPKCAISAASAYVMSGIGNASSTSRGSAVSTPSTSVQISMRSAPRAAPRRLAVRSDPPRPSVVGRPSASAPVKPGTTSTTPGRAAAAARICSAVARSSTLAAPKAESVRTSASASAACASTPRARSADAMRTAEARSPWPSIRSVARGLASPNAAMPRSTSARRAWSASSSAITSGRSSETRRPVAASAWRVWSAARASASSASAAAERASVSSASVTPPIADTTTTGAAAPSRFAAALCAATRRAAASMRSASASDEPPNFITTGARRVVASSIPLRV